MRHKELRCIGSWIGPYIDRHYPFCSMDEAVLAFLDFTPREHYIAYEEYHLEFIDPFLQAYIRSCLERHPKKSLRSIAPIIARNTLSDIKVALMNNDFPLRYDDRDILLKFITSSRKEFEEMLEGIAMTQATAKMTCIIILSRTGKVRSWHPETWDQ